MVKSKILIVLFFLVFGFCKAQEFTTFIIVRHAEKVLDGTQDPSLSDVGKLRANRLAYHLNSQELAVIFTTQYSRNITTVYPTAQSQGIITKIYEPLKEDTFLPEVLKEYRGKTVLICGHSNTVPNMVNFLIGENRFEQISEDDYNDMFVVTITEIGNGNVTVINY